MKKTAIKNIFAKIDIFLFNLNTPLSVAGQEHDQEHGND